MLALRVGLPDVNVVASKKGSVSSAVCGLLLLGEVGVPGFDLEGEPMVGRSFMAFSKTWGRSNAPGGWWCLLGLPWGVCCGLMKGSCDGVPGRSISVPRVWSAGGGIGSWKPSLLGSAAMSIALLQEGTTAGKSCCGQAKQAAKHSERSAQRQSIPGTQVEQGGCKSSVVGV